MDLLEQRGEISDEDLSALKSMGQEELVGLIVGLNRSWYRLLESLEDAHSQDLKRLEETFARKLTEDLQRSQSTDESCLTSLEKKLADGLTSTKKTNALLVALEKSVSRR